MKKIFFLTGLFIGASIYAQKNNIFLQRDFWKTNPSIEIIENKIVAGNNIAQLNSNAFDAVVYALLGKVDNATIKYLLTKKGNDVNKKTHDGRTYIFWAAYKNNLEIMKYLVKNGARKDIIDTHGYTFLNFAASTGVVNKTLYEYSFSIGADITKEKSHNGANALMLIAPYLKDFSLVDYFISKGASLQDKDNNNNGIFEYAVKGGNLKFLNALLKKGVTPKNNAMVFASQGLRNKKNTLATYQFLESKGVKVNVIDEKGKNPLHAIAYNSKDLAIYNYFINKGVSVNLQDKEGNSPFMNAANSNTLKVVQFLSKYIKDINAKNKDGHSALTMAVNRNTTDVIKFLLEKGAAINTVDKEGNTLAYYVINNYRANNSKTFEDKLKLLIKNGLIINKKQHNNNTLIHIATSKNNVALLQRLEEFSIDINAKNDDGLTPLQIAAMKGKDVKIIKYLVSKGADKTVKTDFNESVYDLALENEILKKNKTNISFLK